MQTVLRFVAVALFACVTLNVQATNYYFSAANGDDNRTNSEAQNSSSPWKSLNKLNEIFPSLKPGDSVLFNRGDVFYGSIFASASGRDGSPIVFAAYGSGEKPVISGLQTFTGWYEKGRNVWEADASAAGDRLNVVLLNGHYQPIGRYPNADALNAGYLVVDSYSGNSSITSNALSNNDWTGGEVVIRKNRWIVDRNKITSHNGNTVNYTSGSGYYATTGYGYFIQNHPRTLDQDGEWYFQNKKLGVYLTSGSAASYNIQGSIVPVLVSVYNQCNLAFSGLAFAGANTNTFEIRNAQNLSILDCSLSFSGLNAVDASVVQGLRITGSEVKNTANVALNLNNCSGTTIQNNNIAYTGAVAGMGESGDGSYTAILLNGNDNLIAGNSIESTGYVAISFNGSNVSVQNNLINNYTLVKDDGGGIYTWNNGQNPIEYTNRTIKENIILNGHSAADGTNDASKKFSHGIYLDDNSANVDVNGNSIAGCEGFGLYVHNARQSSIKNNTAYNNTVQFEMIEDDIAPNSPIRNTEVRSNIFFSLLPSQLVAEYKSRADDLADFGTFDENYYCRPGDDNAVIGALRNTNGNYNYQTMDLDGWKAMYGKDAASKASPKTFPLFTPGSFLTGNKYDNGSFNNNAGGLYAYSPASNCQTSWNSSALDGGCLAVNFSSSTTYSKGTVIIGIGAVTAGKKYLLRFSLKGGSENRMLDVYLRKSGAPYNDVSDRKQTAIKSFRKEVALLFTPTESTSDASIGIDVPEQTNPVYFDNIDLREVSATDVNLADSVKFIYNAAANAVTTGLALPYIDVSNKTYNGSVSTTAFSSVILLADNTVTPPAPVICSATGTILHEQWNGVLGNDVVQIPLALPASLSGQLTSFEGPQNAGDNYGSRIRGYICPPQTGAYTFYIAGDDATELWLSSDETDANKAKIAYSLAWTDFREWTRYPTQKSASIVLQAGKKYYIEALQKQGGGGNHLSVAWQLPDGVFEAPINGMHLSPYVPVVSLPQCFGTGSILREQWNNVDGNDVAQIPLTRQPSFTRRIASFEGPKDTADSYGSRIRGYLCPPQAGYYTFWIAGDDATELWLSTSNNPAAKVKIAYNLSWTNYREWNKYPSQKSALVYLEAGQKYYVEALQKEGGGGDNLSVAWQLPDGTMQAPISGIYLSPFLEIAETLDGTALSSAAKSFSTENMSSMPESTSTISVVPNPFNSTTTVVVKPVETGQAMVELVDLLGRVYKTLYKGILEKNVQQNISLSGDNLIPGIYFIRYAWSKGFLVYKINKS